VPDVDQLETLFRARGTEVAAIALLADELRSTVNGDVVTFVRNRNINYTNVCTFKCSFCGFSKGPMSLNLRGIVSQRLLPREAGEGRSPAVEVMLNSPLIADLIFKGDVASIKEVMKKSRELGMQTFDQALFDLYEMGKVTYEDALRNADSVNDLRLQIKLNSERARSGRAAVVGLSCGAARRGTFCAPARGCAARARALLCGTFGAAVSRRGGAASGVRRRRWHRPLARRAQQPGPGGQRTGWPDGGSSEGTGLGRCRIRGPDWPGNRLRPDPPGEPRNRWSAHDPGQGRAQEALLGTRLPGLTGSHP
jgi:hypothetical protein